MHVISFSLFGADQKYRRRLKSVISSIRHFLPGWKVVVYSGKSVPESLLLDLASSGILVVRVDGEEDLSATAWRFRATLIPGVTAVLFRDTDSVISAREAREVKLWLDSESEVHVIRDHPFHSSAILAGLCGVRGEAKSAVAKEIKSWRWGSHYGCDQDFLAEIVYQDFSSSMFLSASFHSHEQPSINSFATGLRSRVGAFCGESITSPLLIRVFTRWARLTAPRACEC
jgi:hypothetical protein